MHITRRRLLQILATSGASIAFGSRFYPLLEAYADEHLSPQDLRGPGLTTFSRSVCRDCANHCSLAVRQVDGLPIGLQGTQWSPASAGALCMAGQSQLQTLFDPDRLRSPILRGDAGQEAATTSWEEALTILDDRIGSLVKLGAGERIVVIDGRTPSLGTRLVEAWVQSIPGARYVPFRVENALDQLLRGFLNGGSGGRTQFRLARSGTLLLTGFELLEMDGSPVTQMREHGERREDPLLSDGPTIYLGPRQGPTAVKADLWTPCQPGAERDILLALAEALSRNNPDRERLMAKYVRWVPEAADPIQFAARFSLDTVAMRHDLDPENLHGLMNALVKFGPSVSLAGPGLLRQSAGAADARAALALNIWTGGFQEKTGISWTHDPLAALAQKIGLPEARPNPPETLADIMQPLLNIKRSPVDVMLCIEANLAHELPGRDQVVRALSHIPFLASFTTHEDETAQLSHLTVPTLTDLESWDIPAPAWGVPDAALQVQRPAVQPVVDGRSTEDILLALSQRGVGGEGFRPPAADGAGLVSACVRALVSSGKGTLVEADGSRPLANADQDQATKAMLAGEAAWISDTAPEPKSSSEVVPFESPPEPFSDLAPNQVWLVPFDGPAIQGGRILNRPMMMELSGFWQGVSWEPWLEIHPEDAHQAGLTNGDQALIRGPRAEINARVVVTNGVVRGVATMPVGFGHRALGEVARDRGRNPLELSSTNFDLTSGLPVWGPVPVFIHKI